MGNGIMRNLNQENVLVDKGKLSISKIKELGKKQNIKLPEIYINFTTQHNGASLNRDAFDYFDSNRKRKNRSSIAFISVEKIDEFICGLLDECVDDPGYFYEKLIPFGDNGGGDFICFDYRNHNGNKPPIIIWAHDIYENSNRISFIANNFEEFINMLYEHED